MNLINQKSVQFVVHNSFVISLPIYYVLSFKRKKDKTVLVGLNFYRNAHYYTQNKLKKYYHELVYEQLPDIRNINQYTLEIDLYYKNKLSDPSNIIPMIEKFYLDALQDKNVLQNDSVLHHNSTSWRVVGQDKLNPRCELTLKEIK